MQVDFHHPWTVPGLLTCLRISSCALNRHSSSIARNVPISFTSLGITLVVLPPWKEVMEKTDGLNGLLFRLTICCKAMIKM